jgi:hypothetical protein
VRNENRENNSQNFKSHLYQSKRSLTYWEK